MKILRLLVCIFFLVGSANAQESEELLDLLYKTYHDNDDSIKHYFEISKKLINSPEDTVLYMFFKIVYFHAERNVDSTLYYGHALAAHPIGSTDNHKMIYVYRYMSRRLQDRGLYDKAHEYALIGLEHAEKKGDINDIAYQLLDISNNYHDFEDYDIGIKYGKRAFNMLEEYEQGNPLYKAYALNCIAINFDDWNMPDSALFYHFKVFDYIHLIDSSNVQFTFNNIANTLLKNERFAESLPYLLTALKLNKRTKSNRNYNLTTNYTNLGTIAHKTGDYLAAKQYFDSAHYYADLAQNVEKWRDLFYQDYQFNKTIGNFKKALDMQDQYVILRDSIFNTSRAATLSEMETKYRSALKDQQIAEQELEILNKQSDLQKTIFVTSLLIMIVIALVTILALSRSRFRKKRNLLEREKEIAVKEAQINAALESQEEERKRFAQDLHDGFGQLISSLRLFIDQLREDKDLESRTKTVGKSEKILEEMHREIRNIAFNLMPATLIQSGLAPAIKELGLKLNQTGKINVQVDTFEMEARLSEIEEISIYRVIQEWVNNIIKYANASTIDIQLIRHENEIIVMIEDNGDGFDIHKLEAGKGNGWRNIQSRANRIGASIQIDSKAGMKGSTLEINLPISIPETVEVT